MRRRKPLEKPDSKMDMTPMIDCVFLLIIFFMIVTELNKLDIVQLKLPDVRSAVIDKHSKLIINVEKNGDITAGGLKRTIEELRFFMQQVYRNQKADEMEVDQYSSKLVKIRVDEMTEFRHVQAILSTVVSEKFYKVAFGANKDEKVY